ncbi:Cytidine and dCMP deaminase domain-containing protein 1 [Physocladia obscura]|uniref:Cytidine and dCMP deaminase domain-containing protein 1 n=1 Tax=Physocladia obscura TaxID=109957 RepID=A0AAD5T0P3_9FUNG|nr:Cytidine and dCMP deaminase domain-containing protein 1 [Physocladia obscura]
MANPVDLQGNALNLSVQQIPIDISLRSATRVRNHDLFMLFSLWMEKHPRDPPTPPPNSELWFESSSTISPTLGGNGHGAASNERTAASYAALRTGAVLVDSADRVVSIDTEKWELAVDESTHQFHKNENILQLRQREHERAEQNRRSVMRLVSNNSIALTLFIPQWDHGDMDNDSPSELTSERPDHQLLQTSGLEQLYTWPLDHALENSPGIARRYPVIVQKFARTTLALNAVARRYNVEAIGLDEWRNRYIPSNDRATADFAYTESVSNNAKDASLKTLDDLDSRVQLPYWARHAMVLAHIAAKRTDDPKLGVGSVFVDEGEGRYFSIGWNGYPKKSQHLDYPQSGADDSVEYEELKYDYILHSEQNALLWRNSQGVRVREAWVVVTKMPCDECSPMLADVGIRKCITIPQQPKNHDDPSRLRGLTYSRVAGLMKRVVLFHI